MKLWCTLIIEYWQLERYNNPYIMYTRRYADERYNKNDKKETKNRSSGVH